jgi:hypothetical protein
MKAAFDAALMKATENGRYMEATECRYPFGCTSVSNGGVLVDQQLLRSARNAAGPEDCATVVGIDIQMRKLEGHLDSRQRLECHGLRSSRRIRCRLGSLSLLSATVFIIDEQHVEIHRLVGIRLRIRRALEIAEDDVGRRWRPLIDDS